MDITVPSFNKQHRLQSPAVGADSLALRRLQVDGMMLQELRLCAHTTGGLPFAEEPMRRRRRVGTPSRTLNGLSRAPESVAPAGPLSGQVKGLKIERLSDADLLMTKSKVSKSSGPEIAPPGPDVPTECAAWSGGWSGQWQAHGYQSRSQLWVRSVDKDCNASIASSGTMEWKIHNVQGGRISNVFCNRQTGGVCRFVISSDLSTLTANCENAQGGRNWGEFTKVLPK